MDYGVLIRRAWQLTWRNRFLWVLGLFATSTVGSCSATGTGNGPVQWQANSADLERFFSADLVRAFQQADPWLSRNIGWVLLSLFLLAFLAVIVFVVVSFIAQGGMAEATEELALGRSTTPQIAWGTGLRTVWRYVLLWMVVLGLAFLLFLGIAVVIGFGVAAVMTAQGGPRTAVIALVGLLSSAVLLLLLPVFVGASVVVAFAQRAIAIENAGPWHALSIGLRLVRRNPGTSALAWVVSFAMSMIIAIGMLLAAIVLVIPLGALGVAIFYSTGAVVTTVLALYAILAAVAIVAGLWAIGGVANAFFWNYWTLIYLRLTGRLTEHLEPPEA